MELSELNLSTEQLSGVQAILQSETDKVRTKYNKEIKELKEKLPVEKTEAEIALEERLKVLEDKEKAIAKQEQLNSLSKQLSDKGINGELAKYLNISEDTNLDEIFKMIVGDGNNTYKPSNHQNSNGVVTKEQFNQMSYAERVSLYNADIELYNALSK
ncbi:MAG: DUF4355 domain-containing protein [Clostridium sp.]|uniref:capsid assembly scaffolding protein Gp46 family protein n=1 Tax=Clostridium sp. TaxID=1506 RepID=UPI0025BF524A|nr:DUF4355 domain-containing protein [Clostridium sp.]MCE5221038.1 DUF4355 domain-containing protein [Clostridium sp.]